jgi:nucleotide-binding universal stress UspA family protein
VHIVEPVIAPVNTTMDPVMNLPIETGNELFATDLIAIQDEHAKKILADTVKKYGRNLQVIVFEEYGSTAESILHCGKEFKADLIVIGTHSRTGIDRFFMGSVAEDVIRHSEIPVLVVPMKKEDE